MKTIQIDDDLYQFIAANTQQIGESASDILRRLLWESDSANSVSVTLKETGQIKQTEAATTASVAPVAKPALTKTSSQEGSVFDLLNKEEVATQKGAVGRFLFILSKLHRVHQDRFEEVLEVRGRERHYFGRSAAELEASGSSIKPKQIPSSEYWVTTNNNTPRKKLIIFEVAKHLGYDDTQAETLRELV